MRYWWVIVLFLVSCIIFVKNYRSDVTCPTPHNPSSVDRTARSEDTKFLIIIAEARSGSTWLGSFFKENENVLHFFEPLDERVFSKVVDIGTVSDGELTKMKLEVLSNECTCKFSDVKYPSMGIIPSWSKSLHRMQGYLDDSGTVLPKFRKPNSEDLSARLKARAPDLEATEELCNRVDLVSAKIIRLQDLASLLQLPSMGCQDFKVLHLIRDPRPIIQSRMATFGELNTGNGEKSTKFAETEIRDVAQKICGNYLYNLQTGLIPEFKDRYKVVKYEDVAADPINYAREIYSYVGLEFTTQIRDHIVRSTTGSRVKGKYEVIRNTSEVVNNWKRVMDPQYAKLIEEECGEMLRTFGYLKS